MSLKLMLTKAEWEGLDEGIKGLYEEKDGGYSLSVDGLEDTSGLKSALQKERAEREKLAKQIKAWSATGKTPEEISELLTKLEEEEAKRAEKAGEWEKLKAQILESHRKELVKKDEELGRMRSALESNLVDAAATAAIAEMKGIPVLLLPHVKAAVKVAESDGKYSVQVVDAAGTPRVNAKGEPLSIKELIEEMRQSEIFGRAFEATGTTGGGASGGGGVSGKANPFKKETWNLTEQGRVTRDNPELAQKLREEARAS